HRFLAEATVALASSLDYEATLARIPHLAVPPLADWCSVDVLERDGAVRRIGLASADSLQHITAEVGLAYPPDPDGRHPRTQVLRTPRDPRPRGDRRDAGGNRSSPRRSTVRQSRRSGGTSSSSTSSRTTASRGTRPVGRCR